MSEGLAWGILGAARIARGALVPAIKASRNGRVAAVASRSAERAAAFAAELGIERSYGSYDDLLADPEIDAVYNALPNSEHAPLTLRALAAGKHVLCEKPFALTAAEGEAMDEAARERGLVLMEAFMYRFHPQIERALDLVRGGAIGQLRLVRSSFLFNFDRPGDIRWDPTLGGGSLYDVGCYCLNAARTFAGREPISLSGFATSAASGVDESFAGLLDFGEGLRASFDSSFVLPRQQRIELVGSEGSLTVVTPFTPGQADTTLVLNGQEETIPGADQYRIMAEHFADAVLNGAPLRYPASEAIAQMRSLEALTRSARNGGRPEAP
jgi:xylose dehydrogenase (NAD/NADP)